MPNPVRIYVLHHPDSKLGAELTNRIYDWFRLPSLEGIPVYVRSVAGGEDGPPPLPASKGTDPNELEYLIPLVDDHMVRDPVWHDYLTTLAKDCQQDTPVKPATYGWMMFPVSLNTSAFNLPSKITRWNFIRHGIGQRALAATADEQKALEAEETLKHLTEAMARDLNGRLFPELAAERFKIFISYSRADNTDIAKTLRDYIQGETQCQVFLDENDIGFGQLFGQSLEENVNDLARAMIVVNGDNYADRPWCRWEIRNFTKPRPVPLDEVSSKEDDKTGREQGKGGRVIHVFNPLLVVDALEGPEMTRVVPELSHAPMIRWKTGRAKLCFSVLMREVLLGLRDVLVARQTPASEVLEADLVVNRLPGPVAIQQLLEMKSPKDGNQSGGLRTIHHPGNGLPLIELRLLRETFKNVRFRAFRDIMREGASKLDRRNDGDQPDEVETGQNAGLPLRGKVIAISTAYSPKDLAALGYLPQHQDEALIHLLRPLVRMGADLLYGGNPPFAESSANDFQSATRNITITLLQLLSDERREDDKDSDNGKTDPARGSLVFIPCSWPRTELITASQEAAFINICRVLPITPQDAGLTPWPHPIPEGEDKKLHGYYRYAALTLSEKRRRYATKLECQVPGDGKLTIRPAAFIFIGGKLCEFSGIMPGIMEEFLHAAKTRQPIYLLGGLGGAAGVIARALCAKAGQPRPPELTVDYYLSDKNSGRSTYEATLAQMAAARDPDPREKFEELWSLIETHRVSGLDRLFNNGLSNKDNKSLILETTTFDAVRLVWEGVSKAPGLLDAKPPRPAGGRKK